MRGPKEPRRGPALSQLHAIPDGSLLIADGKLLEVGATRRIENLALARKAIEVSAVRRVVMPGFVDSHTRLLFPPAAAWDGKAHSGPEAVRGITGMRMETRARLHLETMVRHGTTTVEVKTGSGVDLNAEWKLLRVIAALKKRPIEAVPTFLLRLPAGGESAAETMRRLRDEFLPRVRRRRLAAFVDFHVDEASGLVWLADYLEAARQLGFERKVHVERAPATEAIRIALAYGAATVDHLEQAGPADAAMLGRSTTVATLMPAASFYDEAFPDTARILIDAGAAVAIASDFNPRNNPILNMQAVVRLACRRMRMTPAEAISAATINGAHALGCADKCGSLEPGKSADLLLLNISDYRELPRQAGTNLVHSTMKRGEFIYEEAKVGPLPPQELRPAW